jgi:hypothetical protein
MMNLQAMRESYGGKRVELPSRGVLACQYCGSHLICYNVVPYSRMDGKGREAQIQEITGACLRCSDARCGYTSMLPLTVRTASAVRLHPALPEQLEAVRAWLAM